ncbi:MAG: hypothetical protein GY792_35455 [Gammaproteobacteria bacterium]|nr:hypothetical protein [Gammaproteobacteria bacterium]
MALISLHLATQQEDLAFPHLKKQDKHPGARKYFLNNYINMKNITVFSFWKLYSALPIIFKPIDQINLTGVGGFRCQSIEPQIDEFRQPASIPDTLISLLHGSIRLAPLKPGLWHYPEPGTLPKFAV